ncbi:MAG: uracil-DNA glycosylase [Trueperaceae bacterium]
MTLADLESKAAAKDPALAELSNNLVFGEGNPDARLVLVGEAPGQEEDLSGRPFVGRAGQLLDRILASVDLDRDEIYITNIVKFRPPDNRNPRPEEVAASEPLLIEQLRLIRPQIIATLGNVATQHFLRTREGISKCRGSWREWNGIRLFPLYHPAYLLRNPSREHGSPKWQMWEDMKTLRVAMDSLGPKSPLLALDTAKQGELF